MKISLLFYSLILGVSVALAAFMSLIPRDAIDRNFFRFIVLLALLLLAPFLAINPYESFGVPFLAAQSRANTTFLHSLTGLVLFFGIALVALFALFSRKQAQKPTHAVFYGTTLGIGIVSLFLDSLLYRPHGGSVWWENVLIPANLFSSAALFGSVLFAMLLGHWYLVQFDLDKKLLKRVCGVYCLTILVRAVLIGVGLWIYWKSSSVDPEVLRSVVSFAGHGLFFWMRIVIGLVLPLVLALMIYETAKMGANQACTGLLYIAVLFVIMGEMVSRYIFFLKGVPL